MRLVFLAILPTAFLIFGSILPLETSIQIGGDEGIALENAMLWGRGRIWM